jgi:hypothetical protein
MLYLPGQENLAKEGFAMSGPGEYFPDPTEGITNPEDLPKPKIIDRKRSFKRRRCPRCGKSAYRNRECSRVLHDIGDLVSGRPRDLHVTYSQHHCTKCRKYFNADMSDLALPKAHYTHRVVSLAVRLVAEDGLPYQAASWHLWRDHRVFVPWATIQNWLEAGGEKGGQPDGLHLSGLGSGRLLRLHRRR